ERRAPACRSPTWAAGPTTTPRSSRRRSPRGWSPVAGARARRDRLETRARRVAAGKACRRMTTLYEGKLFDVVQEEGYEIVDHPGSVAIVPVDRDGRVVLVRQRRVPAPAGLVGLPAGAPEPGAEPEATARAGRREETGPR